MEKIANTLNKDKKDVNLNESITLNNRKDLKIEGIVEIISTAENGLCMKLKDTNLTITGENIHITKLDIATGILEASGNFFLIKYGKTGNILKRIFKWNYLISYKLKTYA